MSSNTTETNKEEKKKGPPQIVKLNKALALDTMVSKYTELISILTCTNTANVQAEKWVSNMSKLPAEDESFETQSRPARLGLGAKVSRTSTFVPSDDPVERKLYYKLNAQKRKAAKIAEELAPGAGDDDYEDNEDSRTGAFEKKKRAANPLTPPIGKKKRRKDVSSDACCPQRSLAMGHILYYLHDFSCRVTKPCHIESRILQESHVLEVNMLVLIPLKNKEWLCLQLAQHAGLSWCPV
ncbi:hypothetical protein ACLB2K_069306 [Fragaria x ananassa]